MQTSHILRCWNLCAEEWEWAGRVACRSGCPDSTPAICLCPFALQVAFWKTANAFLLVPFLISGIKKKKKNLVSFQSNQSLWVLFQIIAFRELNASRFSTDALSGPQVGGSSTPQANSSLRPGVFSTFPYLLTESSSTHLTYVIYTCGSSSFCYDLLPSRR